MGICDMARVSVVALVALLCAGAHAFEEVADTPASLLEAGLDDESVDAAERALNEYSDVLMQTGEDSPQAVLDLTKKIKAQTEEIHAIKKKKTGLAKTFKASHEKATFSVGGKHTDAMKKHIAAGAEDKNLDAVLAKKHHELAQMTLDQHAAAKNAAMGGLSLSHPTKAAGGDGAGAFGGDAGAIGDHSHLFDNWLPKYATMKSNLAKMVSELTAHTAKLKSEVSKQHTEVTNHMGVVKKAYVSVAKKEAAAKAAEKATKEKMSKAVEKKTKQVQTEEKKKKMYEKKVKELMKGMAEERAKKEEIRRLKALNAKIKADCEKNMKEKTQRINVLKSKVVKLEQALAQARAEVVKLSKELEAQKKETERQTQLKISQEKARKLAEAKLAKAIEKIQKLEAALKAITAKYNKMKASMDQIHSTSNPTNHQKMMN